MTDNDPNIIVRLIPLNERTRNAWKDAHNASFYVPASVQKSEYREITPDDDLIESEHKVSDVEPEIRLSLNDFPKDITEGFVFGKDKHSCDIYCGEWSKAFNISRQAFSITINKEGQVALKYFPHKSKISVQYGDQEPGSRTASKWILFPDCEEGIVIKVAKQLEFRAIVPNDGRFEEGYRKACVEYVMNVESAVTSIPILTMHSATLTMDASQMPTSKPEPFYYRRPAKELGSGSRGKVYLVYDASTGEEFAGKEFHKGQVEHIESHILTSQSHKNIVRCVGFTSEGGPLLVMEYVRWGNLARPWCIKDRGIWMDIEIAGVLYQCLNALAHLHATPAFIHGNITPENILVEHRHPRLYVKLGGFGLTKEGSNIGSKVSSGMYTALEVSSGGVYKPKSDIWSLGAVVMQMLRNGCLKPKDGATHGAMWCRNIENVAVRGSTSSKNIDQRSSSPSETSLRTKLWDFISNFMLKVDPKRRFSARDCLLIGKFTVFEAFQDSEAEPQPSQLNKAPAAIQPGPSVAGPSSTGVSRQQNTSIPMKRPGSPPKVTKRQKTSASDRRNL